MSWLKIVLYIQASIENLNFSVIQRQNGSLGWPGILVPYFIAPKYSKLKISNA